MLFAYLPFLLTASVYARDHAAQEKRSCETTFSPISNLVDGILGRSVCHDLSYYLSTTKDQAGCRELCAEDSRCRSYMLGMTTVLDDPDTPSFCYLYESMNLQPRKCLGKRDIVLRAEQKLTRCRQTNTLATTTVTTTTTTTTTTTSNPITYCSTITGVQSPVRYYTTSVTYTYYDPPGCESSTTTSTSATISYETVTPYCSCTPYTIPPDQYYSLTFTGTYCYGPACPTTTTNQIRPTNSDFCTTYTTMQPAVRYFSSTIITVTEGPGCTYSTSTPTSNTPSPLSTTASCLGTFNGRYYESGCASTTTTTTSATSTTSCTGVFNGRYFESGCAFTTVSLTSITTSAATDTITTPTDTNNGLTTSTSCIIGTFTGPNGRYYSNACDPCYSCNSAFCSYTCTSTSMATITTNI